MVDLSRLRKWVPTAALALAAVFTGSTVALAGNSVPSGYTSNFTLVMQNRADDVCVWRWTVTMSPLDVMEIDSPTEVDQGVVVGDAYSRSRARGQIIDGYAWAWSKRDDGGVMQPKEGSSQNTTSQSTGNGSIKVYRKTAGEGHRPHMTCDWKPTFKCSALVTNTGGPWYTATATATGTMQGSCAQLPLVNHNLSGTASATSSSPNDADPQAIALNDSKDIASATAVFSCTVSVSASTTKLSPGEEAYDVSDEETGEAYVWDAKPGFDLHGNCKDCSSWGYATYSWY